MSSGVTEPSSVEAESSRLTKIATDLHDYAGDVLKATATPGLSVAAAYGGKLFIDSAFGVADLRTSAPMKPDTVTRGGSMSKAYLALALFRLVDAGVVDLHDDINQYCSSFAVRNPHGRRAITLYDLLTFRSGLSRDVTDARLECPESLEHFLRRSLEAERATEYRGAYSRWTARVGERVQYSNLGIALIGHIIEQMNPDGLTLDAFVRREVTSLLGQNVTCLPPAHTDTHVPSSVLERLATGYSGFGRILIPSPLLFPASYPGCTLLTTPREHLRLLLAVRRHGDADGTRLVSPALARQMMTPQVPMSTYDEHDRWWWGLGLMAERVNGATVRVGIPGRYVWGWSNESWYYPEEDLAIVVAWNRFDMLTWHTSDDRTAARLVMDYVVRSVRGAAPPRSDGNHLSNRWKASFLIGAILGERLGGLLGLSSEALESTYDRLVGLADGTFTDTLNLWDRDGYRAGLAAVIHEDLTPDGVRRLLSSGGTPLDVRELDLLYAALGGQGDLPLPLTSFWE